MRIVRPPGGYTVGPAWVETKLVNLSICQCSHPIAEMVALGTAYGVDVKRLRKEVVVCNGCHKTITAVFIWAKDAKGAEGYMPLAVFELAEMYQKGDLVLMGGTDAGSNKIHRVQ